MSEQSDYMGKHVYSRDQKKLGKVTDVWSGERYGTEHVLVIGRALGGDIFIPMNVVELADDRLVVPYAADFIKNGPHLSQDRGHSADDMEALHTYYARRAA